MSDTFSIKKGFSHANKAMQDSMLVVAILTIILGAIGFTIEYVFTDIYPIPEDAGFFGTTNVLYILTQCVWGIVLTFITSVAAFALHAKKKLNSIADWKLPLFPAFAAALLALYVGMAIGIVLLIVPGIILAMTYGYAIYPIIDTRMGIVASFKESARLTRGMRFKLLWLSVLMMLVMIGVMFVAGVLFGIWAALMPFFTPDALSVFLVQLGSALLTIWMMVVCVDIFRQMQALKAAHQ